jgi:BirA family biotin operon repressor/biotin-[acetyl-CoA-carboxylase] ligase
MLDVLFDADAIRRSTFVRHVEIHGSLPSTNDRAAELARTACDVDLPALIVAREQTAGRGRGSNQWWSRDGALTFSLLLDANSLGIGSDKWPLVSLTTAVATCDVLSAELQSPGHCSFAPQVKWPNDVLLDGRKICGILIDSPANTVTAKRCLIVGVGVNVNNSMAEAPLELRANSIALCDTTNCLHSLQEVLTGLMNSLEQRLEMLASQPTSLHAEVKRLSYLTGQRVCVQAGESQFEGAYAGIAEDGALVVETLRGREAIYSGTVRVLRGR